MSFSGHAAASGFDVVGRVAARTIAWTCAETVSTVCQYLGMRVSFAQSARRHRVGTAHVHTVMRSTVGTPTTTSGGEPAVEWIGTDDRGVEVHIIALPQAGQLLVIHAMSTRYRRGARP